MKARPMGSKLIVFSVPERAALGNGLFAPNARAGMYSRADEVWIVACGPECRLPDLTVGKKCYVSDGFEYEPTNLDLWAEVKDDPKWADLKAFSESVCGDVVTQVIHERSVIAVDD